MLLAPAGAPGWLLLAPGAGITVSRWTSGATGGAPGLEPTMPPLTLLFEFVVVLFTVPFVLTVPFVVLAVAGSTPWPAGAASGVCVAGAGAGAGAGAPG